MSISEMEQVTKKDHFFESEELGRNTSHLLPTTVRDVPFTSRVQVSFHLHIYPTSRGICLGTYLPVTFVRGRVEGLDVER